jgi:hypothetical protein
LIEQDLFSGEQVWGMLKTKNFHLHHWMYCSLLLLAVWMAGLTHPLVLGALFGGIAHGVQFSDWDKV